VATHFPSGDRVYPLTQSRATSLTVSNDRELGSFIAHLLSLLLMYVLEVQLEQTLLEYCSHRGSIWEMGMLRELADCTPLEL
jgi:hypothetical protein